MAELRERDVVIPGQFLGEDLKYDNTCYTEDGKVYALVRGLLKMSGDSVSVIPMKGPYMPKIGDIVIGTIIDEFGSGIYLVDMKSAYYGIIKEEREERDGRRARGRSHVKSKPPLKLQIGDLINGKISSVDEVHESKLTGVWKLEGGLTMDVEPKKVPRIIGKHRSMINLIKEKTGCNIAVGHNGIIWIKGGNTRLAIDAIRKVEAEAHTTGLTDRITKMLDNVISGSNKE